MNSEKLLEARNLKKYFPMRGGRYLRAVNGVSFELHRNEILGIVGESGCGKSTLGRLSLRLIMPTQGQVFFHGNEITTLRHRDLARIRREAQMVFQNPFASFNPKIRIGGALTEVCRYYKMSREEGLKRIASLFNDTGLSGDLLVRWPQELSGGQLQRLAITRALLSNPALIVADEPLSALDVSVQAQLLNLLSDLRRKHSTAFLFISHDMTVVEYLCDRVAVMYMGRIVESACTAELFSNTLHPYTKSLIAAAPRLDGSKNTGRIRLNGETANPAENITGCPFAPRCPQVLPKCRGEAPPEKEAAAGHTVYCHLF
jgi:oligopeptide/dipeptide ABC transporter ATP-binding protein